MKVFFLLSCLPIFAAAGYSLLYYRQLNHVFRVFSLFLFVSALIQFVSLILWYFGINNMPLLHLYIPAGFVCLALFYRAVWQNVINPLVFPVLIGLFVLYSLLNSVFIQHIFEYDSHALTAEAVLVIIFALSTFLLSQNEIAQEGNLPSLVGLNWINSGLLIYYASNSLLYYYGEIITRSLPPELGKKVWMLHGIFSIIMYMCFIIGIWKSLRK